MKNRTLLLLCVAIGLLLVACGKTEVTVNNNSSASPANKATPASTPATMASTAGEKIGVPECDEFIAAYDACISSKVPEAARAQYKTAIEQWRKSWHQLATNPSTRASLAQACKTSAAQARVSMKSYNCTF
jgi:hypothetical protein